MARRYPQLTPNHLETVVQSSVAATDVALQLALDRARPASIVDDGNAIGAASTGSTGRRVGGGEGGSSDDATTSTAEGGVQSASILHPPTLLATLQLPPSATSTRSMSTLAPELATTLGQALDQERDEASFVGSAGAAGTKQRLFTAAIGSDLGRIGTEAAVASRGLLNLRAQMQSMDREIGTLQRTIANQQGTKDTMTRQKEVAIALVDGSAAARAEASQMLSQGEELDLRKIDGKIQDAERVMAQLGRKLEELQVVRSKTKEEYDAAIGRARDSWSKYQYVSRKFHDPFDRLSSPSLSHCKLGGPRGSHLASLLGRQHCAGGSSSGGAWRRQLGRLPSQLSLRGDRKSILQHRLSHAVTINCHLNYPIFSLKFDKTGKYFITGADDHLAKLFHLGAGLSSTGRNEEGLRKFVYGANNRGAVLVCTLRGHAGVVTDLDVSCDNSMLATASQDGDVRIWGLRDGCPIAILRGHTGGANMVSWSKLTPFRIVTTGDDGLARMWDIREAALKRYGATIGKRADYTLPKVYEYDSSDDEDDSDEENDAGEESQDFLPPIPQREEVAGNADSNNEFAEQGAANARGGGGDDEVFVPPLPPGAGGDIVAGLIGAGNIGNANGNGNENAGNAANGAINPGAFVAGSEIDEGVRLLSKFQHGEVMPDSQMGTRSQRKAVHVVCIARCPIGGHFATGSDDGLGRIWADEDDERVEEIDVWAKDPFHRKAGTSARQSRRQGTRTSGRLRTLRSGAGSGAAGPSKANLLATLMGHLNSITDIDYSNAGDRILTASQKDGVVRIWSWGNETAPAINADGQTGRVKFDGIKQIHIRLTNPRSGGRPGSAGTGAPSGPSRRRGGSSTGQSDGVGVFCDSAKWTSDDSKIVTSQACPIKEGEAAIIPNSQHLYIWDSRTGQCLMGMPSAHALGASVLISHPLDSSILVSAGGDGLINVWDLNTGKTFFSHSNTLTHGPMEPPSSRGKNCAYLDGQFSPDGLSLVLTDDNGRVTVLDTLCSTVSVQKMKASGSSSSNDPIIIDGDCDGRAPPLWMKEQYCANDYYEMIYDVHGYCIEKGSGQPPHLAPKAVRCTHTGTPYQEEVTEALSQMAGPLPISEADIRFERYSAREKAVDVRKNGGLLWQNVQGKRTFINVHSVEAGRYGVKSHMASVLRKMGASIGGFGNEVDGADEDDFGTEAAALRASPQRQNRSGGGRANRSTSSGRALSSNYEWGDYDDLINERPLSDEDEDDDEYDDAPRRRNRGRRLNGEDEETSDSGSSDDDDDDVISIGSDDEDGGRRRSRRGRQSQSRSQSSRSRRRRNRRSNARSQSSPSQPSRASARQQGRDRRVYEDDSGSEDEFAEMLSTATNPSGEFVEDYNVLGHVFRLPEGARVPPVRRAWVSRMESHLGLCGRKKYAPQVGDSVIYIPKAHYDTLKEYPTGNSASVPWKSWPQSSAWPVVRCTVKDIRYRFPYEQYFLARRGSEPLTSIVAILKLEVTGIPQLSSDGTFPWPEPEFISRQTRSSSITFEVSVFENGQLDFIVPEHLYTWKIKALQEAISSRRNAHGLQYTCYFQPSAEDEGGDVEDAEYIPWGSQVSDMVFSRREREMHFKNSGYNAIAIVWENGDHAQVSAWEGLLTEKIVDVPLPPGLEEDEKAELLGILDKVEEDPIVESWFSHPVDTSLFIDYLRLVEVPMDLSIIRTRLENDYYTNVLSFEADVKLIRENCNKYNERNADITQAAYDLYDTVVELCSDLREKAAAKVPAPSNRRRADTLSLLHQQEDEEDETVANSRRSARASRRSTAAAASSAGGAATSSRFFQQGPQAQSTGRSSRRSLRSSLENLGPRAHEDEEDADEPETHTRSGRRSLRVTLSASAATSGSSRRSRRSTRGSAASLGDGADEEAGYHTPPEDSSDDEQDANASARGRRRSPRRRSAAASARSTSQAPTRSSPRRGRRGQDVSYEEVDSESEHNEESDEDHESEEEEVEQPPSSARSSRRQPSRRTATTPSSSQNTRSSPRARKRSAVRYTEVDSDNGMYQSDEEEEDEPEETLPSRRGTKRSAAAAAARSSSSRRLSPRRRVAARRQQSSDEDESESSISGPSEGESDSEEDESEHEHSEDDHSASSEGSDEYVASGRASTKRRKRSAATSSSAKKKSRGGTPEAKMKNGGDLYYPDLSKWPPIVDIRDISKVSKRILKVCAEADSEGLFTTPVVEAFPEVADSYLSVVSEPIDFRTIEEERLPAYQDMHELQEDLIKVFRNCCVFNGEGTDFYHYAVNIWAGLNNIFKEACEEFNIIVPRRWS